MLAILAHFSLQRTLVLCKARDFDPVEVRIPDGGLSELVSTSINLNLNTTIATGLLEDMQRMRVSQACDRCRKQKLKVRKSRCRHSFSA